MIEIHNLNGTTSYGCFANLKASKGTLNLLKNSGELRAPFYMVTVCLYKNRELQKVYNVRFLRNKWCIMPPPTPAA